MSSDTRDFRGVDGPDAQNLGRAIRVRRETLDLKRRDLALRAGLSYPYVSEIENGNKEPSARRHSAALTQAATFPSPPYTVGVRSL